MKDEARKRKGILCCGPKRHLCWGQERVHVLWAWCSVLGFYLPLFWFIHVFAISSPLVTHEEVSRRYCPLQSFEKPLESSKPTYWQSPDTREVVGDAGAVTFSRWRKGLGSDWKNQPRKASNIVWPHYESLIDRGVFRKGTEGQLSWKIVHFLKTEFWATTIKSHSSSKPVTRVRFIEEITGLSNSMSSAY